MIVIIDNYDSFTYNLVQRIGELDAARPMEVFRNDKVTLDELDALRPTHLIISPGPCTPKEGGISNAAIQHFAGRIPVLGVCLGHQCIGYSYGGTVERNWRLMHGKTSLIHHNGSGIFQGLSNPFEATRYHSLVVRPGTLPPEFEMTAWTDEQEIMGLRHRTQPLFGVQFHPESFLTLEGPKLLKNFIDL
jgi:anthranilate synthase/aminodeoxychorismate synthase-like glutamine amidotransferase